MYGKALCLNHPEPRPMAPCPQTSCSSSERSTAPMRLLWTAFASADDSWPAKVGPVRASLSPFTSSRKSPGHIPGIVPTSKGAVKSILLVYRPGSIPTPCFHRRLNLDSNQPTASTTRRFIKRLLTTRPANHNRKQSILRPHRRQPTVCFTANTSFVQDVCSYPPRGLRRLRHAQSGAHRLRLRHHHCGCFAHQLFQPPRWFCVH